MRFRSWVLNAALLVCAVGLSWKLVTDWRTFDRQNGPQSIANRPWPSEPVEPSVAPVDYSMIATRNPFHPDRNDTSAAVAPPLAAGPPPLVYGSIIFGDNRYALLGTDENPQPKKVAEGSSFQGYRLVSVGPQSVILESQAGRDEVMFYNALTRLQRAAPSGTGSRVNPASSASNALQTPSAAPGVLTTGSATPERSQPANPVPPRPPQGGQKVFQTPWGPMPVPPPPKPP